MKEKVKCKLFNDNFQNYKKYGIPKAQLVIDPVAGSGATLRASKDLNRHSYGFEVGKQQYLKVIESGWLDD